jgi:hypothetical protein
VGFANYNNKIFYKSGNLWRFEIGNNIFYPCDTIYSSADAANLRCRGDFYNSVKWYNLNTNSYDTTTSINTNYIQNFNNFKNACINNGGFLRNISGSQTYNYTCNIYKYKSFSSF